MQLCYIALQNVVLVTLMRQLNAVFLHQEYYTVAKLHCETTGKENGTTKDNPDVVNRYWLLPNGNLVHQTSDISEKFKLDANFTLTVNKIADEDFGKYFCLLVLNDSSVLIHRHGLNVDGAAFDTLHESYAKRAVIGTVAAAALVLSMLVVYVIYKIQFSKKAKRRKMIAEDLSKGVNRYSTAFYDNVGFEAYTKRSSFRKSSKS